MSSRLELSNHREDVTLEPHATRQTLEYAKAVREAKPIDPANPVRMPFDRSADTRRKTLARGTIEVAEPTYLKLDAIRKSH